MSSVSDSYGNDFNQIIIITPCGKSSSSFAPLASLANYQLRTQLLFANYLFPSEADYLTMNAFDGSDSSSSTGGMTVGQLQSDIEKMIGKSLNVARKLVRTCQSIFEIERSLIDIQFECDLVSNSFLATKTVPSYTKNFIISIDFHPIKLEYSIEAFETCRTRGIYRLRRNNIEFNGNCDLYDNRPAIIVQSRSWNKGDWNLQFVDVSFHEYKNGFGGDDYWVGLKQISIASAASNGAMITLWNDNHKKKYEYKQFKVTKEQGQYILSVSGGDSSFLGSNGMPFMMTKFGKCDTADHNHGGWWFDCNDGRYLSHLNRMPESMRDGITRIRFIINDLTL